jgi:hypothetical protein
MNKHLRAIEEIVERHVSNYSIQTTSGGHVRIILRRGARSRFVIAPATPGCRYTYRTLARNIAHAAAYLGAP